jgi:hypothetical protein
VSKASADMATKLLNLQAYKIIDIQKSLPADYTRKQEVGTAGDLKH